MSRGLVLVKEGCCWDCDALVTWSSHVTGRDAVVVLLCSTNVLRHCDLGFPCHGGCASAAH